MKKRILAMLLLAAMIVTALPLMVLPTLAAEDEANTYEEVDYNKLYVTDGLVFGADFYNTNKYWSNTSVSGTYTTANAATLLNGYRYDGAATGFGVTYADSAKSGDLTIKDGYLDLHNLYYLSASSLNSKIGNAVNGATAQTVRTWVGSSGRAIHLMGVRISMYAKNSGHGTYSNGNYQLLDAAGVDALNILDTRFSLADIAKVGTTTVMVQRPTPTNGNLDTRTTKGDKVYALGTYTPEGGEEGTMIDLGNVVYTATDAYLCRQYPFQKIVPAYVKDAEGNVTANTAGTEYYYPLERLMYGSVTVYDNLNKVYETADNTFPFINNDFLSNDTYIVVWGENGSTIAADAEAGKLYAVRYYNRELTAAEVAQNHFADIMKWFKIDLSALDMISEADIAKIIPAFASFTFESDKAAVEAVLLDEVTKLVGEKYAGTAAEAYAALAAKYQLDLSPLLANPKGMLANTYSFLNGGYLQVSDVKAGYEAALARDYAALWASTPDSLDAYNYLYAAQENAMISLDFFGTNAIWNQELTKMPLPQETTDYKYAGVTYDFTKIENRLVAADKNIGILVKDGSTVKGFFMYNKTGSLTTGSANYPGGSDYYDSSKTMPRQTFTEAEADEIIASMATRTDSWKNFTYEKVELSLFMVWRKTLSDGKLSYYTTNNNFATDETKVVAVYKTMDLANAKAAELAGEGATLKDGVYTSADGKYEYYAGLRPVATAAYYSCVTDYAVSFVNEYIYGANISANQTIKFTQNMKTVGECGYQTKDGISGVGPVAMRSHVSFENGYMLLDPSDSGPYFGLSGTTTTGTYYLDTVMTGGDTVLTGSPAKDGTKIITFRAQKLMFKVTAADTSLYTVGGVAASANSISGMNTPFRVTVASAAVEGGITMQTAVNGTEVIGADKVFTAGTADQIGHSHAATARIYTYRVYDRILTDAEQAQNHFADIAKFFKLNITGYDALDAAGKAAVHAAVADITFADSRIDAQNAVNAVLNAKVDATYAELKAEYPAYASFIETAREYRIDVADYLDNATVMPYLTALSFDGLSSVEAQALVAETASDVLNFYVHMRDGEDGWNAWLRALAAADTVDNVDALLALPFAERLGILDEENNTDAAVIAAFAEEATAKYATAMPEYDSYNALYVQDGILIAADFFKLNRYWNTDGTAYTIPVGPSENTAWQYDADGDGEVETYDLTVAANCDIVITAEGDKNKGKTLFTVAQAQWRADYTSWMNENFRWGTSRNVGFGAYNNSNKTKEFAPFVLADGYIKFRDDYPSSGGMVLSGMPGDLTAATGQLIASYTDALTSDANPFLFHNIRPVHKVSGDKILVTGMSADSSIAGWYGVIKYALDDKGAYPSQGFVAGYNALTRSLMQPIAEEYVVSRVAELAAADAASTYTYVKKDANNFDVKKGDTIIEKYKVDGNGTNPNYDFTVNPEIALKVDTVIDFTQSITLTDGVGDWSYRTEQGTLVSLEGVDYASGTNPNRAKLDGSTYYIGWGKVQPNIKMYALRQYDRVLTDAEVAQNHFADIAKFYRLDLTGYYMMDADQQAATHLVFTAYTMDGALERDELQAILNAEVAKLYEGTVIIESDAEANAAFIALAAIASLDLAPIKNLTAEAREAFAYAMLSDFDPDYAVSAIVAYHYAERTELFAAMTFAGYQVRLDSGASLANYAGVRAVFDINETAIAAIIEKNDGAAVTLTVSITGEATVTTTIVYTVVEGVLTATGADIYERGEGKSVNILVAYKGEEITKENLLLEYGFDYTIAIGDAATAFDVNSATFGDKVSAAEVYGYFYENGYASDRVVAEVVELLNTTVVNNAAELKAAITEGDALIALGGDIAMTESITVTGYSFVLDGKGHTITMADGAVNTYALFDSANGTITFKNVTFDGIRGGAILRSADGAAVITIDNVTVTNCEHTQQQGLFRLVGKCTIRNSTFKDNACSMVITLNYDAPSATDQLVENCVFENNTCTGTAVLYYVKGNSCTVKDNEFIGNTVNCANNGATVYMGFTEGNVVTGNLFKNNAAVDSSTSTRVSGGIFFGYETVFENNAFIGNAATNANGDALGNDVCTSLYYTDIDLSGNYWGGSAPVEGVNYFVQHKTSGAEGTVVIINDYLTTYAD